MTNKLYDGRPGDDASIVVIKTRPPPLSDPPWWALPRILRRMSMLSSS